MPVDGRLDVPVVVHANADLRPLGNPKRRTGDRAVVGEHAHAVVVELLDDGRDTQVERIAVSELHQRRRETLLEARGVCRECRRVDW